MLFKLFLLFVSVPLVELALLFKVAEWIGWWETFWLVVLTGVLGSVLTRQEGARTFRRIHYELQAGRLPALEIVGGFLVFAAGLLLLTPGILTDVLGFAILIPGLRRKLAAVVLAGLKRRMNLFDGDGRQSGSAGFSRSTEAGAKPFDDQPIEVEAVEVDETGNAD